MHLQIPEECLAMHGSLTINSLNLVCMQYMHIYTRQLLSPRAHAFCIIRIVHMWDRDDNYALIGPRGLRSLGHSYQFHQMGSILGITL